MSDTFSKRIAYDVMYGEDSIIIDNKLIQRFLYETNVLNEVSKVQGVYSDEGLYDFFGNFKDYKKISKKKAKKILGWQIVNYILDDRAQSSRYDISMVDDTAYSRANAVSYGGAILGGMKNPDKAYQEEMQQIADALGWKIIKWMGVGKNRKSQVVVIPSSELNKMSANVNEDIAIRIETIKKVDGDYVVYPKKGGKRLGTHKSKKKALSQLKAIELSKRETKESDYTFGPDWIPTSLAQRKKMKRIHGKSSRSIREQENNIEKLIAIYPGRFQPFGPHHLASYKFLKKRYDEVYVVTSNKTGGTRHPMNFSEKKKHMTKMGIPSSAIKMEKQVYIPKNLLSKYDPNTTAVVFAVGEKDEGRLSGGKYFKPYRKNYMRLQGFKHHGYTLELPHTSIKVGGKEISGTTMRKLLGSEKYDSNLRKKFFKKMFGYFDEKTFNMFTTSFNEEIKIDVEVGDTILVGKFKNKKMVVKSIGTDDHGMPTINGRKATTFRYQKQGNVFKEERELLLMGGAYGHMAHPFDDYGLTFGDMKSIIDQGLQGKLDKEESVTEKLDGQNLMISMVDGIAVAARNKGDLKRGGMDLQGITSKFKHHIPTVRNAFVFSMRDIKSSIEKIPSKLQNQLFNNGKNWVNIEIIYPDTKNVIDYDGGAQIVFHGILKYDDKWSPKGEIKSGGKKLADIVNKVNGNIKKKFAFKGPNILKMTKSKDYSRLRGKFFSALGKLQNIYRLKDSDEVSLWHQHFWLEYILAGANSTDGESVTDEIVYPLMRRWAFSDKSYKIPNIKKDLKENSPEFLEWVLTTDKLDHAKMLKDNMRPFEKIFFEVGAEILGNVSNWIAPNPDKTIQSLRADLEKAAKSIKSKNDASSLSKLNVQLKKIKSMGDLNKLAPTEGLVFKYNGKVYKFTGFFAPINQITGLMKFSR